MLSFRSYLREETDGMFDDEHLAQIRSSHHAGNLYHFREPMANHFRRAGHSDEAIGAMEKLYDHHRIGGEGLDKVHDQIAHHIRSGDDVGRVMMHKSDVEHRHVDEYLKGRPEYHARQVKDAHDDYEWAGDKEYETREQFARRQGVPEHPQKDVTLYRKGSVEGRPVQSWTTDPRGAHMGNAGHIGVDHSMTLTQAKERGYKVLGGFATMMGSPGESEITLAHMPTIMGKK